MSIPNLRKIARDRERSRIYQHTRTYSIRFKVRKVTNKHALIEAYPNTDLTLPLPKCGAFWAYFSKPANEF